MTGTVFRYTSFIRRLFPFAGLLLLAPCVAFAQSAAPAEIGTQRGLSPFQVQALFEQTLHPTSSDPMGATPLEDDVSVLPTHIDITYTSPVPVPVLVAPGGALAPDELAAVLPASSTSRDVLIDLRASPAWQPGKHGLLVVIYTLQNEQPQIQNIRPADQGNAFFTLLQILRHPLEREAFGSFSYNFLLGYRMAGIPMTAVAGVVGLLVFAFLLRKFGIEKSACVAALAVILVWQVRFFADSARMAVAEEVRYFSDGDTGELGHVAVMARFVDGVGLPQTQMVTVCTQQVTPWRYFLSPREVTADPTDLKKGGVAVVDSVWKDDEASFSCGAFTGKGKVLKRYANGDALVQFPAQS